MKNIDEIAKQQEELQASFAGVEKIFAAASQKFQQRFESICTQINHVQETEAKNLQEISEILKRIIGSE